MIFKLITDAMNTQVNVSMGHSPNELVFGQKPIITIFPLENKKMLLLQESN